jgi:hypothetical protein
MSARRLRWRGPAQQQRVLDELLKQLAAWHQGWSVDGEWLSLSAAEAGAGATLGSERLWLRATSRGACAWLGLSPSTLARVGECLAKVRAGERFDLGERIGRRALQALLGQWLGATGEAPSFDATAPLPEDLQARFGGLRFQLQGREVSAVLIVDAALCDRLAPAATPTLSPLATRAAALGEESVSLEVRLDLGEATLADAHALQIGDVLVSGTRLDSNFDLIHPDARVVAHGRLRRHDRRLAFALQSAAPTTRKQA